MQTVTLVLALTPADLSDLLSLLAQYGFASVEVAPVSAPEASPDTFAEVTPPTLRSFTRTP